MADRIQVRHGGRYGNVNGQWDWIPDGTTELVVIGGVKIIPRDVRELAVQVTPNLIKSHLARLSLHKRVTGKSEATMGAFFEDLAQDLAEFSELAVAAACSHIRRHKEDDWFPSSAELRKETEWQQRKIDALMEAAE